MALKQFPKDEDLPLWCDKWLRIYNDLKDAKIIEYNSAKHDFFDVNKKVDSWIAGAYARDYETLDFETLVNKFKDYYKSNPPKQQQQIPRNSFASTLQGQQQHESSSNNPPDKDKPKGGNGCPKPCGQHPSWSKCFYLNPAIRPANVTENPQVRKEIDDLIAANSRMATSVKSIQERFKKKKEKENAASNLSPPPVAPAISTNPTSQLQSSNTHMATALAGITGYNFCASFIADNGSNSHVINCFY